MGQNGVCTLTHARNGVFSNETAYLILMDPHILMGPDKGWAV